MKVEKKRNLAQRRHWKVRKKVSGTAARPRMSVCFTNKNIYVQFIDDTVSQTMAAATTRVKGKGSQSAANVETAKRIGALAAEAAQGKGIKTVVFDRGGARYHGKVKALADAAREAGLQF
jgi:large subunit ribosomal protein L18